MAPSKSQQPSPVPVSVNTSNGPPDCKLSWENRTGYHSALTSKASTQLLFAIVFWVCCFFVFFVFSYFFPCLLLQLLYFSIINNHLLFYLDVLVSFVVVVVCLFVLTCYKLVLGKQRNLNDEMHSSECL